MNDLAHDYVMSRRRMSQKARYARLVEDEGMGEAVNSDYLFDNDVVGIPDPDPDDALAATPAWQRDSRIVYDYFMQQSGSTIDAEGRQRRQNRTVEPPSDFGQWGLEFMGEFNYNLPKMGIRAAQTMDAPAEVAGAMFRMMQWYDAKPMSWRGTRMAIKNMFQDPTTYVGLGTLGFGFIGRAGVKQAGKSAVMQYLQKHGATIAAGAAEGAAIMSADDASRQTVSIAAKDISGQKEFDFGQNVTAAGIGAAAGGILAGTLPQGATAIYKKISPTERLLTKVYDNAEEAQEGLVSYLRQAVEEQPLDIEGTPVISDSGPNVTDPNIKGKARARAKVRRKSYTNPDQFTDIVRAGVTVDRPDEAEAVVAALGKNYEITDEGWQLYGGGYFDRKVLVKTPEGKTAEVQIFSREISDIKEDLHKYLEEAQKFEKAAKRGNPSAKATYDEKMRQGAEAAAAALLAGQQMWQPIYDQIGVVL